MPDGLVMAVAAMAGGCGALTAYALIGPIPTAGPRGWLERGRRQAGRANPGSFIRAVTGAAAYGRLRSWLAGRLERAGLQEPPEAAAALGLLAAAITGLAAGVAVAFLGDAGSGLVAGLLVAAAIPPLLVHQLQAAIEARRGRLLGELGPILELVSLELSGGAPPMLALESVLGRSRSELGAAMRAQLIGSRVAGSASFDGRLDSLAGRLQLPALRAMAMILGLSRDYGSGVGQGIRALAADLRRARRRQVIELSRGALNRVLIPAAVGVLLPFMAILLFPAVTVLLRSFA
jgi:Flp pilus assembly protein TadB